MGINKIERLRRRIIGHYRHFIEHILKVNLAPSKEHDLVDSVLREWQKPHRKYHSLQHLDKLVDIILSKETNPDNISILIVLALYHDVFYEIGDVNNELFSAQRMIDDFNSLIPKYHAREIIIKLSNIIKASDHIKYNDVDLSDYITRQFLAYDLYSAFGCKHHSELIENEKLIYQEYQKYPTQEYLVQREIILNRFLVNNEIINYIEKTNCFSKVKQNIHFIIDYIKNKTYKIGIYSGSFNPFHKGHLNIIQQAEQIFDKVIILIGHKENKQDVARTALYNIQLQCPHYQSELINCTLTLWMKDHLSSYNIEYYAVRGIRNTMDAQHEIDIHSIWKELDPNIKEVLFLSNYPNISSSAIRNLRELGRKENIDWIQ